MSSVNEAYREVCNRVKEEIDNLAKASALAEKGASWIEAEKGATSDLRKALEFVYSLKEQFGMDYIEFVAKRSNELSNALSEGNGSYRDAIKFQSLLHIKHCGSII